MERAGRKHSVFLKRSMKVEICVVLPLEYIMCSQRISRACSFFGFSVSVFQQQTLLIGSW